MSRRQLLNRKSWSGEPATNHHRADRGDASNRALSEGPVHSSSRIARECATAAESHCLCLPRAEPWGGGEPNNSIHLLRVEDTRGSAEKPWTGKMASWRGRVAAAEARKAEGASITTLRSPSPPSQIGRLACVQGRPEISQFKSKKDRYGGWHQSEPERGDRYKVRPWARSVWFGCQLPLWGMKRASCEESKNSRPITRSRLSHLAVRAKSMAFAGAQRGTQ